MKRVFHKYLLIAAILYIIAGVSSIFLVSRWVTDHYFETTGQSALNLATLAANSVQITDEQLDQMERISFQELLLNENNQELSDLFKKTEMDKNIKYAYVIRKLDMSQLKYYVSNSDSEFYDMPVGTPLDWIWLMDVIVNKEEQSSANLDDGYYADKNRYTHVDGETVKLYEKREKGYFINNDEWGSQISAMVPIYTKEGQYIGLLGVDVYASDFYQYLNKVVFVLFLLTFIPTVILSIIYFYFHIRYRKEMKNIVFLDKMTGLYTRAYYEDYARQLAKKLRRAEDSFTVIMIDIDEFKAYNDYYGHARGDEIIKVIGNAIHLEAEAIDACAGRYGGEEFIILIPNLSEEEGDQLCEKLRRRVENLNIEHEARQGMKQVTISLGIYTSTNKDFPLEPKLLMEKADKALYQAKRAGRNCVKREH